MIASCFGGLDVVEFMIARGVCVNARNHEGHTALYLANDTRYRVVANYLRSKGGIV